jgi:sugar phosphate isomerase/epimerase
MFSKMLQVYDIDQAGDVIKDIGFEGVDLTVRANGHVLPENAAKDLPGVLDLIRGKGLTVPMLTTDITSAQQPFAEDVVRTAAENGVRLLKLGYWPYKGFGTVQEGLRSTREDLAGLEKLLLKHGVKGCLHVHSGDFMTVNADFVYLLLQGFDREALGAYFDPGHNTCEGARSGWKIGMDLVSPWISMVAVKSMGFFQRRDERTGEVSWECRMLPLREGMVRWREVFTYLKQIGFDGPVSLHSEYEGSFSWRHLETDELVEQTRDDLRYIRGVLDEVC